MKILLKVPVSVSWWNTHTYKWPSSAVTLWTYITGLRAAQPHYCLTLIKAAKLNPSARSKKQTYASKKGWKKRVQENDCVHGEHAHTQTSSRGKAERFKGTIREVHLWDYLGPKTGTGGLPLCRYCACLFKMFPKKGEATLTCCKVRRCRAELYNLGNHGWSRFTSARLRTGAFHRFILLSHGNDASIDLKSSTGSFTESSSTS